MEWYFVVLIAVVCIGIGTGFGIFCEKLGQYLYFRRLVGGNSENFSIPQRISNYANDTTPQEKDIAFIGDSITQGYHVEKFFDGFSTVNRGIGSEQSGSLVNRIESNIVAIRPKNVVFLIGINDLLNNIAPDTLLSNIKTSLTLLKEKLPTLNIICQSIYPVNEEVNSSFKNCGFNQKIDKINDEIEIFCQEKQILFVDVNQKLKNGDGMLIESFTKDGLHLLEVGYDVVTALIKPLIKI